MSDTVQADDYDDNYYDHDYYHNDEDEDDNTDDVDRRSLDYAGNSEEAQCDNCLGWSPYYEVQSCAVCAAALCECCRDSRDDDGCAVCKRNADYPY